MQIAHDQASGWTAELDAPYRGHRTYLHGTDLYSAAAQIVAAATGPNAVTRLDVRFPKFSRNLGVLRLIEGKPDREKLQKSPVRIQAICEDGRSFAGWYEESDALVYRRSDNWEAAIVDATSIQGNTGRYIGEPGPPLIEIIVFVTKKLLNELFSDESSKWVFTALISDAIPDLTASRAVTVKLENAIGDRAASCIVMSGSDKIGEIYFGKAAE